MPSDLELFVRARTEYGEMPTARAAETLAAEYDLSPSSVRGRLSRANSPYSLTQVLKRVAEETATDKSVERQLAVIEAGAKRYNTKKETWGLGMFVSDLHVPYTRWDALELVFQMIEDLKPDVISAQNDALDNAGYGRWDDNRTIRGKLWSGDVARQRRFEDSYYSTLRELSGGAALVQVLGNHDAWYYNFLREKVPQDAERIIADYMEFLDELGVIQFTRGFKENHVRLSPNLIWWHGQFIAAKSGGNATNTIKQFISEGVASSVVVGHTHRPTKIEGYEVGYNGVRFYNSGCLSRLDNVPYMKRDPKGWALGVVINRFNPQTRYEEGDVVTFSPQGKNLTANYNGRRYAVPLDRSTPEW